MDKPISIKEAFSQYAKHELEMIKNSDPEKLYHRVIPNVKDKDKGYIDFLYKKIIVGGMIDNHTIYLNKLITKYGNDKDVDLVIAKITDTVNKGDMKIVNQL